MSANGSTIRPTKKQRELLSYIEQFIGQHGYSPSYREIMGGLGYTSVATVSLHINSLIRRGHLRKRDRSARSLEVVDSTAVFGQGATGSSVATVGSASAAADAAAESWLAGRVGQKFTELEQVPAPPAEAVEGLAVLLAALNVLGMEQAADGFEQRLQTLRARAVTGTAAAAAGEA